ncbi:MAG: glycosyltransferase family 4 protein [Lachnospiraceae bacterium]|jgi:glycosyltransferase involved in cell wall biosynthesis|nr:glycosyltransferase family 4 protein [Lachnospiraceae bacterium]MCH4030055.1 glycosyltransferase family 4 protein [Lachnospiraceae bacterium]MCH4070285.1 glycosyltransferase family 4 protein [Lachnospiraceae bacterium]MCH4107797.1 glycosyltransferase family 4 protein [Lachnospiraceae bacterium]MCI1361506.1 glycosyltransferase family 4 protein [Lachnospiraceae bacterium]
MKVLLIDQIAKVNYKFTYPLTNGLINAGVRVDLVIDQKKEDENCACRKYRLFNTDEKNIGKLQKTWNYITSYHHIEEIIKKNGYDIIHTEWYTFSPIDFYYIRKLKNKYNLRYVATVHDILPFNEKFYDMHYHKKLYSLADAIILQAPGNVKRFTELFPEDRDKIHMIPHGHMLDYVESVNQSDARDHLNIPKDKKVYLFFGQIKKVKGVDLLLRAFLNLLQKRTDIYLIVAGSVWKADFSACQEIIDNNNFKNCLRTDIRYIPNEEVKYYYSAADICVLPYTDVYQSGVIQLAFGYRKAVVSSDLPAFTQFVKEGETGFVAKNRDVDSLTSAMQRAADCEDLSRVGRAGYELVKRELDWNLLTKRIVDECYR